VLYQAGNIRIVRTTPVQDDRVVSSSSSSTAAAAATNADTDTDADADAATSTATDTATATDTVIQAATVQTCPSVELVLSYHDFPSGAGTRPYNHAPCTHHTLSHPNPSNNLPERRISLPVPATALIEKECEFFDDKIWGKGLSDIHWHFDGWSVRKNGRKAFVIDGSGFTPPADDYGTVRGLLLTACASASASDSISSFNVQLEGV